MTIQGIDSKVVTQRTTDYMRENNANAKNMEFAQTIMAKMGKDKQLQESQTVGDVKKGEGLRVNPDDKKEEEEKKRRHRQQQLLEEETTISGEENVGYGKSGKLDIEI